MVCYDRQYLAENQNIEKIAFKIVQMKFLAMHIINKKLIVLIYLW